MSCCAPSTENKEKENCGTGACHTGKKCCPFKAIMKILCLGFAAAILYSQFQILDEVKKLNESVDFVAEYLDEIKATSSEIKDSSQTMKEQIQDLKKDEAKEAGQ